MLHLPSSHFSMHSSVSQDENSGSNALQQRSILKNIQPNLSNANSLTHQPLKQTIQVNSNPLQTKRTFGSDITHRATPNNANITPTVNGSNQLNKTPTFQPNSSNFAPLIKPQPKLVQTLKPVVAAPINNTIASNPPPVSSISQSDETWGFETYGGQSDRFASFSAIFGQDADIDEHIKTIQTFAQLKDSNHKKKDFSFVFERPASPIPWEKSNSIHASPAHTPKAQSVDQLPPAISLHHHSNNNTTANSVATLTTPHTTLSTTNGLISSSSTSISSSSSSSFSSSSSSSSSSSTSTSLTAPTSLAPHLCSSPSTSPAFSPRAATFGGSSAQTLQSGSVTLLPVQIVTAEDNDFELDLDLDALNDL